MGPVRRLAESLLFDLLNNTNECALKLNWAKPDDILRYVGMIDELLNLEQAEEVVSQRGLYYKLAPYFDNQGQVNHQLQKLVNILGTSREDLGVIPAPKGMVFSRSLLLNGNLMERPLLIDQAVATALDIEWPCPAASGITNPQSTDATQQRIVLILEKHSAFESLVPWIPDTWCLVTGRGFPDLATKKFLVRLVRWCGTHATAALRPPKFRYVGDYDPHGIHIYYQYVRIAEEECCNDLESRTSNDIGGLWSTYGVMLLGIDPDTADRLPESHMPLTAKDITMLTNMMVNPGMSTSLQILARRMLAGGYKCEIEGLDTSLFQWVRGRLSNFVD